MKKVYEKPMIVFENFSLSTNIAAGCETKTSTQSENQCGVIMSGIKVFFYGMTGCEDFKVDNAGGDGQFNDLCYHVPTGLNNLFNS